MKVNAFGRRLTIQRIDGSWVVFAPGNDGKRRRLTDILIPADLGEEEIVGFLDDLLHEWATAEHPSVVEVK
ncbi:MAG: hypothetical protein AAFN78_20185 [Pseudomonadota bacterium]